MAQIRKTSTPKVEEELLDSYPTETNDSFLDAEEIEDESFEPEINGGPGRAFDIAAIALCIIGIGISSYMTYTKVFNTKIEVCVTGNSCEVVTSSQYAYFMGLPVGAWGLVFYMALLIGSLTRATFTGKMTEAAATWRSRLNLLLFIGGLGGVAFTAYLKAMEIFVIGQICSWCVASAITVSLFFGLSLYRFLKS